jgi:hypothetical protein
LGSSAIQKKDLSYNREEVTVEVDDCNKDHHSSKDSGLVPKLAINMKTIIPTDPMESTVAMSGTIECGSGLCGHSFSLREFVWTYNHKKKKREEQWNNQTDENSILGGAG